jgi:hypothetical protein
MDGRTKNRLIKVLELSKRGVGGEKDNADRILQAALIEHGITIDDIKKEEQELIALSYHSGNKADERLLVQIIIHVADRYDILSRKEGKKTWFKLTNLEHIEVEAMYKYYRKLLKKEQDLLLTAFIHKHNIFPATAQSNRAGDQETSMEDQLNMMQLMGGLRSGNFTSTKKRLN